MTSEQGRSPTSYKIQLGKFLSDKMKSTGVEVADAAGALRCSEDKIRTYLRGRSSPNPSDFDVLLGLLGVSPEEREDLQHLATEARKRRPRTPWGSVIPERLKPFFRIEETAETIRYFHPTLVYGPAQKASFARALLTAGKKRAPAEVDRLVDARMARAKRLTGPRPPKLVMILSEAVTLQYFGGAAVRKEQLLHLVDLAMNHGAEIRIVRFSATEYLPIAFPFTLFSAPDQETVAYLENLTDGIFVDEPDRVAAYEGAFERLLAAALPLDDSVKLLVTVASEL
jgi:hypothetical protein